MTMSALKVIAPQWQEPSICMPFSRTYAMPPACKARMSAMARLSHHQVHRVKLGLEVLPAGDEVNLRTAIAKTRSEVATKSSRAHDSDAHGRLPLPPPSDGTPAASG